MISILLVDDETELLNFACSYLEDQRGFHVQCVSSAKEALRTMQDTPFDVVVSDYQMPVMDGIQFLKKLRGRKDSIPFIIFTGKGREEIAIEALNAGADFYLQKGGEPEAQFAELSHIIRQVVRQHRAEDNLGESEIRYQRICEGLTDYLYTVRVQDGQAVATTHGAACFAVTGYTTNEFASDSFLWLRMVSDDDRERVIDHFRGVLSGKPVPPIEHRIVRKDGRVRWVRDTPILQLDATGHLVSYDGVIKDITETKLVERALTQSEEFNRSLVENLPDYIIIYGPDLKILYVNPATSRALGYSAEKLIGTPVLSYVAEECREGVAPRMATRQKDNEVSIYETDFLTKDGLHRTVIVKGTPVQYHNNPAFLILLIDITDRKKFEMIMESHSHELMQLSASLAMVNRKLNLLSSITRHDINNQLAVLQGYRAILEKKQPDPSFAEYFQKINDSAQRISSMIQFTRTYESIGVNAPAWQDVRTVVEDAAKDSATGQVRLANELPAGADVYADTLIVRVFYNLIDNAVRYGNTITTIRFSVRDSGKDHVIVCEDDGIGIPAGEKEKIFERGFGQNTGLGLFLAREILDITGITIKETGEPGKGARFEITVPEGAWRMAGKFAG
jgi:PAS domain S-box-containing protein